MNAGIYSQCVDQDNQNNNGQQGEDFELEEVLECAKLDVDEDAANYYAYQNGGNGNNANNDNYNYNQNQNNQQQEMEFLVGPYCSANGKSVLLGVCMDEVCSYIVPKGTYEQFNYGNALPYSSESIISNGCISCMQPVEDDGNNQNYNYNNGNDNNYNQNGEEPEVLEVCERLYEDADKCESNLDVYGLWPNTMTCDFISGIKASGETRIFSSFTHASNAAPKVFDVLFGVSTVALGGVAYYFHKKLQGQSMGLDHGQDNMA